MNCSACGELLEGVEGQDYACSYEFEPDKLEYWCLCHLPTTENILARMRETQERIADEMRLMEKRISELEDEMQLQPKPTKEPNPEV